MINTHLSGVNVWCPISPTRETRNVLTDLSCAAPPDALLPCFVVGSTVQKVITVNLERDEFSSACRLREIPIRRGAPWDP